MRGQTAIRDERGRFIEGHSIEPFKDKISKTWFEKGNKVNLGCERPDMIGNNFGNRFEEGNNHPFWKGDEVGYNALHAWVRRRKPKPEFCEICRKREPKELASKDGTYKRDVNNFLWLCIKCHRIKDGNINNLKWCKNE